MVCRTDVEIISLTREGFNRIRGAWVENELNKKLSFLRKFSFFKGLSDSRLMSFLHMIEINKYEKNHVFYSLNDLSKYLYFIFEGSVRLFSFIENDYPLKFINTGKQTENENISKYLKGSKTKFKTVPIMVLSHGSFFGDSEILNKKEKRETQAVVESESAVIF